MNEQVFGWGAAKAWNPACSILLACSVACWKAENILSTWEKMHCLVRKNYTLIKRLLSIFIMHLIFLDHRFRKEAICISLFHVYKTAL